MLDRITGKPVHEYIQLIGCFGVAAGLPWSKVPLSLAFVLLALNFFLRGDFADVVQNWKRKKALLFFIGFVAIELLSILWSQNKSQALSSIYINAPYYVTPLLIVAKPFSKRKQIQWIGLVFILACFVTSFINIGSYLHWWGNKVYDDFRGLSQFVSHVRYSLIIVLSAVFCLVWFIYKLPFRWFALPLLAWFLFYTYFAQVISGYIAFTACVFVISILYLYSVKSKFFRLAISVCFIGLFTFSVLWIYKMIQPVPEKVKVEDLPTHTLNGTAYWDPSADLWENGYPIYGCYCPEELEVAWNKISDINYQTGKVPTGDYVHNTLHRYMTSKGLCKDSAGVSKLSESDISNIEKGINSILVLEGGIKSRLYTISYQLQNASDPNGHSLLERLEYWKAATHIVKNKWLIGVGVGDIQDEFNSYYDTTNSKLIPENRHRAHQQYLTVIISSGVVAFAFFMLWWFAQVKVAWRLKSLTWLCFITISMGSFLTEDTLETQLGGTFVTFFFGLFIAHPKWFMKKQSTNKV